MSVIVLFTDGETIEAGFDSAASGEAEIYKLEEDKAFIAAVAAFSAAGALGTMVARTVLPRCFLSFSCTASLASLASA